MPINFHIHSAFILPLAIVALILLVSFLYWLIGCIPKPLSKHEREIYYAAAFYKATEGLTHGEVYTKRGQVRANIAKRITMEEDKIRSRNILDDPAFRSVLAQKSLINQDGKASEHKINRIAEEMYKFYMHSLKSMTDSDEWISVDSFFLLKQETKGDWVGVYVLKNTRNGMFYVGQATRLLTRVNQHFTGHGNGDVYADYKYGDEFLIKMVKLSESGYSDLDELEKDMIDAYHAYDEGYNKTRGNG